jgi:hypothetical protein
MIDLQKHSKTIALALLGEPNAKLSTADELKWNKKGSLSINIRKGTFTNFEDGTSGGMIDLIRQQHEDVNGFLNALNLDDAITPMIKTNGSGAKLSVQSKAISANRMRNITKNHEYLTFSPDKTFCVVRWKDKKVRPFHKRNDMWFSGRPDGLMPIFKSDGSETLPVLIVEGEKTYEEIIKAGIYAGKVCTWHGGSNSYDKADWSAIEQDRAIIYPDHDKTGYKAALGLKTILEALHIDVVIAQNPSSWEEKDDLADHLDWDVNLYEYAYANPYVPEKPPIDSRKLNLVHASEAIKNIKRPQFVIKNVLEKDSLTLLYGSAKAGKSFVSISMAASVSMGIDWFDHKTKEGLVVYLAGEGQRGIARRLLAWQQLNKPNLLKNSKFHFSTRGAQLLNDSEAVLLRDEILKLQDHYGASPQMIVIDTLARNFGAGNENSTEDMNRFIASIDRWLREEFGSAIVLVHHTGHDAASRARGSSVLPAAVDWSYQVTREDDEEHTMLLDFEQTLIKDGKPLPNKRFQFQEVELLEMVDEDGLPTTSGALKEIQYVAKQKSTKLYKNQIIVKEAIEFLHFQKQQQARNEGIDPSNVVVTAVELNNYVKDKFDAKNVSGAKTRALETLKKKSLIGGDHENGYTPADIQQF